MKRENATLARIETKSYRFGVRIRGVLYLACANVHRTSEETRDENTNERILGEDTGGLEVVLTSRFARRTNVKQVIIFGQNKVRDMWKRESGGMAVKSLRGNVGNAREVLKKQLVTLVGNVPRTRTGE